MSVENILIALVVIQVVCMFVSGMISPVHEPSRTTFIKALFWFPWAIRGAVRFVREAWNTWKST